MNCIKKIMNKKWAYKKLNYKNECIKNERIKNELLKKRTDPRCGGSLGHVVAHRRCGGSLGDVVAYWSVSVVAHLIFYYSIVKCDSTV